MNLERASRYKDKLNLISKRAGQIDEWLSLVSEEDFLEDDKTKLALYKSFQEAVEACMKIVVIKEGIVVHSRDTLELYEYFCPFRREWGDQKHRQTISRER